MAPTLQPRQVVVTDSNGSSGGGLDTGAIVGIVIGTIAGILLLWWIIRSCTKPNSRPDPDRQGWYDDTPPRRSRSRSTHSHRHHHHHGRHHSRSHSRRRSTSRPVILEKPARGYAIPVAPQQAYVYPSAGRSRSRSQGRYYASGY
ncbi:uncharacterized protein PODANS_5_805 [Podospora anserina S mat+]|uniref:Podospora anserina S mat+ genomic DNA chromosome 5, supercontig 1 n=1 Tax=Podospora anserina (strain S / ATCC MYA-4624 / DSM 980 / FGSC 10383) TaxID=515849 RepID=B2AF19_PODAN|nr:uncharacterized protein PODANS_5_805 [Podospora anserina S mat+]CAP62036.1 unnamed protein product [Podospora anserina S mat+]CDP29112.1 Putative protein of unknown function [Podospora anserina S mat+]